MKPINTPKLIKLATYLEKISVWSGQLISWLTLLMVFLTFSIVVLRYGFEIGWIAMQESVIYMYALVFLIGIPYTLKHDGHVRVDIFYSKMNPRNKAWVNLLGTLFLLIPVTLFIAWVSWDYVTASWDLKEESGEAGGLPGVYLLKSTILVMTFLLLIQGISQLLLNLAILWKKASRQNTPSIKNGEAD
ncbi:MAG: TRAP transporter small permease subunit [gamma proteobacterium symbiont of Bathyaustriella thionipta]|nr:TRAP transporter small permease subunit [gamma proteobacterium symbiont of Bathyaustriella thionipta]MCU7951104.1 TRAP transporter small permease subunit [gamma proteobacterium symbiont of Bathyaustriella thionipta]MCU7951974.1 TRAP transporter small permease subunit [gamma proteobacterium symbiont of Bathyaustriella thionipta]MCU7957615.1 TRAP transporter small permease subunit [gamma proteobacterium symbiont of Bathyaustriella thionipta]MCU7968751.1 TRAP transporter small permease subunit 